ncbi:MAG: MarR family winged helix-turn-helix transcriptional regulator [Bdellovibrionia bacterium]
MNNGDIRTSIMDSIRKIVRSLRLASSAAEKDLGLNAAQLFVLQQLTEGQRLSINEIAARTHTHQSSVSVVVGRLHDQGLVSRAPSSEDGRRMEVSLTTKGRNLCKKAPRAAQENMLGAISALTPEEQKTLAVLLDKLVRGSSFDREPASLFFEDDSP